MSTFHGPDRDGMLKEGAADVTAPKEPTLSAVKQSIIESCRLNADQVTVLEQGHLLVAVVLFMAQVLKEWKDSETRILISAATNVAVDSHSLLCSAGRAGSANSVQEDTLRELEGMLAEAGDPCEKDIIRKEIAAVKQGILKQRRRLLSKARVLGVTTASAGRDVLDGQKFRVCSGIVDWVADTTPFLY
eukprot:jgi/Mesvir1/6734/Mv07029-RA.1